MKTFDLEVKYDKTGKARFIMPTLCIDQLIGRFWMHISSGIDQSGRISEIIILEKWFI